MSQVEIPNEWQQLQWKQQVAIANGILAQQSKGTISEAAQARAVIDLEARRRAALPKDEPVKRDAGGNVPLRLLRDTWHGEERIRADGSISQWSLDDAKRLIASGVAARADPLPGE